MKNKNNLSYEFFHPVDRDSHLGELFNKVLKELLLFRAISAPRVFKTDDYVDNDKEKRFYKLCLVELYLQRVIKTLNRWKEIATEYNETFAGSWEYYARSKRLECINEYGGEESDYNPDGTIRTDVGKGELIRYSVAGDMVNDDWRDIVAQTKPNDLNDIYIMINANGEFSITEMFSRMGTPIKSYRQDEAGNMVQNDWADEAMAKTSNQLESQSVSFLLCLVVHLVVRLVDEIKALNYAEDNREFFLSLPGRIERLFNLDITRDEIAGLANKPNKAT
jgi:hypothetical protein